MLNWEKIHELENKLRKQTDVRNRNKSILDTQKENEQTNSNPRSNRPSSKEKTRETRDDSTTE